MTTPEPRTSKQPSRLAGILDDPGFRIHLIVYVAVNLLLLVINLMTGPDNLWFFWPLLGWGLGILGHAFAVYRSTPHRRPRPSNPRL